MFTTLALALYQEGKLDKVEKVLDKSLEVLPLRTVPANYSIVDMAKLYYLIGNRLKASQLIDATARISLENLNWAYQLSPSQYQSANMLVNTHLYTLQEILNILNQFDKAKVTKYMGEFQKHAQKYQQLMAFSSRNQTNQ
jgi:tetratricopeptide (TPR) repeat protein